VTGAGREEPPDALRARGLATPYTPRKFLIKRARARSLSLRLALETFIRGKFNFSTEQNYQKRFIRRKFY
jgi:hypothetical protein